MAAPPAADRPSGVGVDDLVSRVASDGSARVQVWRPSRTVSFGPRDAVDAGYASAVSAARSHGFEPRERRLGGRPVAAHTGCLSFLYATPETDRSIDDRYRSVAVAVTRAVGSVDVPLERGELRDSFCPGTYSLIGDGKVAGFAQRVRADAAAVGGLLIVRDPEPLRTVLEPVYAALELPFNPATVGSLRGSGADVGVDTLGERLTHALERLGSGE